MNSSLDMVFSGTGNETAQQASDRIEKDAIRLEKILSRFDPEAETLNVNQSACDKWTVVSDHLWEILQECAHYSSLTREYFNIAFGRFKHFGQEVPLISEEKESGTIIPSIVFDDERKAIRLDHGASLDFGAIGKGLLLRAAQKWVKLFEIKSGLISFGGSSVLARGSHPYGSSWPIAWRDGTDNPTVFHLNETCASFSGAIQTNNKGFQPHIVHPKKLQFVKNDRLVFVQDKCPVLAEVLSTALVVSDKRDFSDLILKLKPERVQVFKRTDHNKLITMHDYESKN